MRTLIVLDNLYTGGVASSFYNYLQYASARMDCSLLIFDEDSVDMSRIPSNVQMIKPSKLLHILGKNRQNLKKESYFLLLYKAVLTVLGRIINGEFARKWLMCFIKIVKKFGTFDLAIAFSQDDGWKSISKGCTDFVLQKVDAKCKAVLIHCDYQNFGGYHPNQEKSYSLLDYIICVSESCKERFCACFPNLRDKTIACENFTDVERIKKLAGEGITYPTGMTNFVTISRLSAEKGLDRTIRVFKKLLDEGMDRFTWTVVGGGLQYEALKKQIKECNLEDHIFLVGNKENPYPYLKNASAFILPSFNEASPMVYGECAVLGIPIITTNTCSAVEMVEKRNWGIVVENSEEGIEKGLRAAMNGQIGTSEICSGINDNAEMQFCKFLHAVQN